MPIIATGYGRKLILEELPDLKINAITEIQAYALGAHHLYPEARTVLDIGGQDTKVIALTPVGKVAKFEMNDRCAAGTGKFLEFMATALQVPLGEFGDFALQADKRLQINSMCTVFAESEATSLMARARRPPTSHWACTWPLSSAPWPCSTGSVTRRPSSLPVAWPTMPACGSCWRKP